jgi:hypothetical protein
VCLLVRLRDVYPSGNDQLVPDEFPIYVERYRWTPTIALSICADLAFVALAVFSMPLVVGIPVMAFFGWFAVTSVAGVLTRRVALRVDAAGVTLGGRPFRYEATTRFHAWGDIEAITLWQRYMPVNIGRWTPFSFGPVRYIGLRRRPGAQPITPTGRGRADGPAYMVPVTGISAGAARNITALGLDKDRLAQAVAAFAPSLAIEDGGIVSQPVTRG